MKTDDLSGSDHLSVAPARGGWRVYLAVFAVCLVLYGLTAQRGPAWQDSGIFQWRILNFDVRGWMGLALSHPLLIVLGKAMSLLPFGSMAWRINLLSALAGAATAANVALLVRRLAPDRPIAAWVAGGFLAVAHTQWWLATICESQMLLVAIFTCELHVLVSLTRRPSFSLALLLGLLNGLALTAHNLALLALPAYGVVVLLLCARGRLGFSAVLGMILGWLAGASGLLALIVIHAGEVGLAAAVRSALFGRSWQGAVLGGTTRAIVMGAGYVVYNFPNLALPLAAVGIVSAKRVKNLAGPLYWAMVCLTGVYLLFAIRYPVPDQFMFFLPFYAMVAVWSGLGLAQLCSAGRRRWLTALTMCSVLATPAIYAAAPAIWRGFDLPVPGRKDLPRDAAAYWLCPWKGHEDSAGDFARKALRQVPPGGVILADGTTLYPLLWVQRQEGLGEGVQLIGMESAPGRRALIARPDVFVASNVAGYYPAWLTEGDPPPASLQKDSADSVLFQVVWREGNRE